MSEIFAPSVNTAPSTALRLKIRFEPDFVGYVIKPCLYGASRPISQHELIMRWIIKGMAYDTMKPEDQCVAVVSKLVRCEVF